MDYKYKYIKYKNKYLQLKYNKNYMINIQSNYVKLMEFNKKKQIIIKYSDGNKICVTPKTAKDINIYKDGKIIIPNPAEYILYHDKRVRDKCIKLRKIERDYYDKFIKSRKKYDNLFKKKKNKRFYSETSGMVDLHKMYPDYKYLYENIKEKNDFIYLRLKLNNVLKQLYNNTNNCFFITPNDIKNFDINKFSNFTNSRFILHKENTKQRLYDVSKVTEEDKNNLVSNYDNLMYMFKNALKDNSRYCKGDFNKAVNDNIVKRLYGFNKVDVFYHFIIFFQELHRIKELSEDSKKNSSIIRIEIEKENRLKLIENIDNIRSYIFKEYSKDFKDKKELLDKMYVIDYIIYSMDVVYNDIVDKLKKGEVCNYIMSIINGFKNGRNKTFEEYLNTILKSSKEEKKVYPPHRRCKYRESKEKNFIDFATLFVDNVCPMELKISVNQISPYFFNSKCLFFDYKNININNDFVSKIKNDFNIKFLKNEINYEYNITDEIKIYYNNIISKITGLKLDYRPFILGLTNNYKLFKFCGEKFLAGPWFDDFSKFNKKLSWHISLNKWVISCLMKREQDIKCIIVHKNLDEKDTYKNKKVYMRISMFNERKELNLEMKKFIGCMIHKLEDKNTNKFYISYLFNEKDSINYYNFRKSKLYPKDLLSEAYNITYLELNTLLYYSEDIGEKLHFYLYKYNNDNNIVILISTKTLDELNKIYPEIIELQLIKTDTLKEFIFIKK